MPLGPGLSGLITPSNLFFSLILSFKLMIPYIFGPNFLLYCQYYLGLNLSFISLHLHFLTVRCQSFVRHILLLARDSLFGYRNLNGWTAGEPELRHPSRFGLFNLPSLKFNDGVHIRFILRFVQNGILIPFVPTEEVIHEGFWNVRTVIQFKICRRASPASVLSFSLCIKIIEIRIEEVWNVYF